MKKKGVILVGVTLFICVLSALVWAQNSVNVTGTWILTHAGQNGSVPNTLKITQDGINLKGTIKPDNGWELTLKEGTINGTTVAFVVPRQGFNGEAGEHYKGTVDGDTMKGTCMIGQTSVEWTAKRSK